MLTGITFSLFAGILQGLYFLPFTLSRQWKWEHGWAAFSLFGMIILNWIMAAVFIPQIFNILSEAAFSEIAKLLLIGCCWGLGAVFFGLGMDKLGMALGYPVLMGLISSMGALVPFLVFHNDQVFTAKGFILIAGILLILTGIVLCSRAGVAKSDNSEKKQIERKQLMQGLTIAIAGGILSSLPNIGLAFSGTLIDFAKTKGVSPMFAGNVVWAPLLSFGGLVNIIYCLFLVRKNKNIQLFKSPATFRNSGLILVMSLFWISSFYLYGTGTFKLGSWGAIIGWPLFISTSIIIGNITGIIRKEWKGAPKKAFNYLFSGIITLVLAIIAIAISNSL